MRIPFDIKYRDKIESGEYKVETGDGRSVRIISWDKKVFGGRTEIVALVPTPEGNTETVQLYCPDGTLIASSWNEKFKLFIVTPDPEMSELELAIAKYRPPTDSKDTIQRIATELLALAKSQLLQSGELLSQEHHEKLMETQYKETLDGVKKNWHNYFMPQDVTDVYNAGRNDVLKDLPRWKKCDLNTFYNTKCNFVVNGIGRYLILDGYMIDVDRLEKLPGFKEDESHE